MGSREGIPMRLGAWLQPSGFLLPRLFLTTVPLFFFSPRLALRRLISLIQPREAWQNSGDIPGRPPA